MEHAYIHPLALQFLFESLPKPNLPLWTFTVARLRQTYGTPIGLTLVFTTNT